MGERAVDITGKLTEEQYVAVASDMAHLAQTPGWKLLLQLLAGAKAEIVKLIHDPNVHKEYISGMLRAIDTIPENVAAIIDRGKALAERQVSEREAAAKAVRPLPFVKPGSSTPAV